MCQKMSSLLLMLYLCIRDGRMTYRTPVNDSGTFVDVSFLIETGKYFQNCLGASFIHGKTLSVPVSRRNQASLSCFTMRAAILFTPLPGFSSGTLHGPVHSCRCLASFSLLITFTSVAMLAWSVPGCHSAA